MNNLYILHEDNPSPSFKGAYLIIQRFLVHYQILHLSNIAINDKWRIWTYPISPFNHSTDKWIVIMLKSCFQGETGFNSVLLLFRSAISQMGVYYSIYITPLYRICPSISWSCRKAWLLITIFAIHSPSLFWGGERITKAVVKNHAFLLDRFFIETKIFQARECLRA